MTNTPERIPLGTSGWKFSQYKNVAGKTWYEILDSHGVSISNGWTIQEAQAFAAALSPQPLQSDEVVALSFLHPSMKGTKSAKDLTALIARHRESATAELEARIKMLEEYYRASEAVQDGIVGFDLHNGAVNRLDSARRAVHAALAQQGSK